MVPLPLRQTRLRRLRPQRTIETMSHDFDRDYWEQHWHDRPDAESASTTDAAPLSAPNPYVPRETADLRAGRALDAGCGTGAEAVWLAEHGWTVTGADISASALAQAAARAAAASVTENVTWVEADLTTWEPPEQFDLVTTNYAHPTIPQLELLRPHRRVGRSRRHACSSSGICTGRRPRPTDTTHPRRRR